METVLGIAVSLFFVMDPIGNIPVINSIIQNYTPSRQRTIVLRESAVALGIMLCFLFFGEHILAALGVEQDILSMTGGVVLFLIGIRMSFSQPVEENTSGERDSEPLVVPIAIPFIAGPGVLGMVMILSDKVGSMHNGIYSLVIAWIASTIVLLIGTTLVKVLGKRGMEACSRLMGLALTAMSVQMFMTGLRAFMRG